MTTVNDYAVSVVTFFLCLPKIEPNCELHFQQGGATISTEDAACSQIRNRPPNDEPTATQAVDI